MPSRGELETRTRSSVLPDTTPRRHGMGGCLFGNTASQRSTRAPRASRAWRSSTGTRTTERHPGAFLKTRRARDLAAPGRCFPPASGGSSSETGRGTTSTCRSRPARAPARSTRRSRGSSSRARAVRARARARRLRVRLGRWDAHARLMLHSTAYRSSPGRCSRATDGGAARRDPEGGYAPAYTPTAARGARGALGHVDRVEDPFLPTFEGYGYQELQPQQER